MGSKNQLLFVERHSDELKGPYLEVGSRDYGSTCDFRPIFSPRDQYIGIDLSDGKGVDLALDLTQEFELIDKAFNGQRFGTIICFSVLEHCTQPFTMAENLCRLLRNEGKICISVPFVWKFHGYPSDYWRFTHEGIRKLFPRLSFDLSLGVAASPGGKKFSPLDEDLGTIPFGASKYWSKRQYLRGFSAKFLKSLSKIGLFRWITVHRYVMAPTEITMIGVLEDKLHDRDNESRTS